MTTIDIVVRSCNHEQFLEVCLQSVLGQSVKQLRVLIIDDASSDASLLIAKKLSGGDARVTVISHAERRGYIQAYNYGINWASSNYFLLLRPEYVLVPGALERATRIMDADPEIVLTHGNALTWKEDLSLPEIDSQSICTWSRQDLIDEMCATGINLVCAATAIQRTRVLKVIGGCRPSSRHSEEMEMWLRLAARGAVAKIDALQAICRSRPGNTLPALPSEIFFDWQQRRETFRQFFKENYERLLWPRKLRAQADRLLIKDAFRRGLSQLRAGRIKVAYDLISCGSEMVIAYTGVWRVVRLIMLLPILLRRFPEIEHATVTVSRSVTIITIAPSFGGAEVHTLGLMKALIDRGHRLTLIACQHQQYDDRIAAYEWQGEINLVHTDLTIQDDSDDSLRKWKELFKNREPDVLIIPMMGYEMGTISHLILCKSVFRRVFYIEHLEAQPARPVIARWRLCIIPELSGQAVRKRLVQKIRSRCADGIIAVSNKVAQRLVQDWGYNTDKVVVVQNGVAWAKFGREEDKGQAFRQQNRIPTEAFVFGILARLHKLKGIDIALRALKLLLEEGTSELVRLVVVGSGPEVHNLVKLSEELRVTNDVTFVGFVNNPADVVSAFDAILFASRQEGLPLGLLEAMAAGCIPIVSRIGGMPEAVNSSEIGWIVPPESPEALCSAMQDILATDSAKIAQMRQNAVDRIRSAFDIDECHRQILQTCGL